MATASDLDAGARAYLRKASAEVKRCRAIGHGWDPLHDGYIVEGQGKEQVYTQQLQCWRCKSGGVDVFQPGTMERIGTREYDYVDGYLVQDVVPDRQGGLSRQEVRQWMAAEAKTTSGRRLRRVS